MQHVRAVLQAHRAGLEKHALGVWEAERAGLDASSETYEANAARLDGWIAETREKIAEFDAALALLPVNDPGSGNGPA